MRIASFLPAATEILFALGLGEHVVGVTFECDFPPATAGLPRVVQTHLPAGLTPAEIDRLVTETSAQGGNLYFADMHLLEQLGPELILTQDLCHVCALDAPTLARDLSDLPSQPRVLSLSAGTLGGMLDQILEVGEATGTQRQAEALVMQLRLRIDAVRTLPPLPVRPRVLALEWLDPLFQGGHWVPEMIQLAGGEPVLAEPGQRSVRISEAQVVEADPDVIVLMPCGYDLRQTLEQFQQTELPSSLGELRASKDGRIYAVDGSAYFSRPGPRLVEGLEILAALLRDEKGAYQRL